MKRWWHLVMALVALLGLVGCSPSAVVPRQAPPGTIRVLAIGNSFSAAALEQYLSPIARASGRSIVIGSLMIGGASLELHARNAVTDSPAYRYTRIAADGTITRTVGVTISGALRDEEWDFVSLQQASRFSGRAETYEPWLTRLRAFVGAHAPQARIIIPQTWAYAPGSTSEGFSAYGRSQSRMFGSLVDAYARAQRLLPGSVLIPCGRAIQVARSRVPEDLLTSDDGVHLDPLGRYIAAATWFDVLFDTTVALNPYRPAEFDARLLRIAQQAADESVRPQPGSVPA